MENKIKFFGRKDLEQFKRYGKEYFEGQIGQSFNLYLIDKTEVDDGDFYGENFNKSFEGPIEVIGVVQIETSGGEYESNLHTQRYGKATFKFYEDQLTEKNLEINLGDVFGVHVNPSKEVYFEVSDPNLINKSNKQSISIFRGFSRIVEAVHITEEVFLGNNFKKTTKK